MVGKHQILPHSHSVWCISCQWTESESLQLAKAVQLPGLLIQQISQLDSVETQLKEKRMESTQRQFQQYKVCVYVCVWEDEVCWLLTWISLCWQNCCLWLGLGAVCMCDCVLAMGLKRSAGIIMSPSSPSL